MTATKLLIGVLVLVAGGGGAALIAALIGGEPDGPPARLELPAPGDVRPDYLADGTPVWVVGHDDGDVSVLSAFDTHRPSNLGKMVVWCPQAKGFDNREHGSRYDAYGLRLGGPAPTGLPGYAVTVEGTQMVVGTLQQAPPFDAAPAGALEFEGDWCLRPDDEIVYHTFEEWQAWDSPTAAVEASPEGWILLNGELALRDGAIVVCGVQGCADAVVAANVDPTNADREFGPLFGDRFIAQVRDGAFVGVTRVMPATATDPPEGEPPAEP